MENQIKYIILNTIKHNGNIFALTKMGYEYVQVSMFVDELLNEEMIKYNQVGRISISDTGILFLNDFAVQNKIECQNKWILPREEMWHNPIKKIYIPKK